MRADRSLPSSRSNQYLAVFGAVLAVKLVERHGSKVNSAARTTQAKFRVVRLGMGLSLNKSSSAMTESLVINEVYLSLQGESTFVGLPCVFVRLTACDLRCSYCDTAYAFQEGKRMSLESVLSQVRDLARPYASHAKGQRLPLVELTGGEPLLQGASLKLMKALCDDGFTVLVETSGAHDISKVDARVHRIMDLKCPSSGESERNCWENLDHLKSGDEIKFVMGTMEDYEWAKSQVIEKGLASKCVVLFSWVEPLVQSQREPSLKSVPQGHRPISRMDVAERIIADALPVRFQIQMHKVIWPPDRRGV